MPLDITIVRHGETVGNASGIWQGAGANSGFSARGRDQVRRLADRLHVDGFDLVVSSDLGRALATAGALGVDFDTDPQWREIDLGEWEGLTKWEIAARYSEEAQALLAGEDVPFGGAERVSELVARLHGGLRDIARRLNGDGRALVVTHGGAILALVSDIVGVRKPGMLHSVVNTAVTRIEMDDDAIRLAVYNDASHLNGGHDGYGSDATTVVLIRHGETVANVEQRWQGHQEGTLTENGRRQVDLLARAAPRFDALYSSPLARAAETADAITRSQGVPVRFVEGVREIGFGAWEGMTADEIAASFSDEWQAFRNADRDEPRGGHGETWTGVGDRVAKALHDIVERHRGETIGVVTHGGATRAYLGNLLDLDFSDRHRIRPPDNTSLSRIVWGPRGPTVAEFNLTPHLEG